MTQSSMEFDLDHAKEILTRTPAVLRAMLEGLSNDWSRNNEGPDTWSPYDVLGHLIHGERTDWLVRAELILQHGATQPFTPFDRFAQFRESNGRSLADLLEEFEILRRQNLKTLEGWHLNDDQLALEGMH
ncbi:MAG: DinB family protein, partial [Thermoanaerobaculia bacterium]